jgi:hypothetical protein
VSSIHADRPDLPVRDGSVDAVTCVWAELVSRKPSGYFGTAAGSS